MKQRKNKYKHLVVLPFCFCYNDLSENDKMKYIFLFVWKGIDYEYL